MYHILRNMVESDDFFFEQISCRQNNDTSLIIICMFDCNTRDLRNVRFRLLYSVLPISVATELRHKRPVPPKRFECVTLLFSGIVGFSDYCAGHADSKGAMKIVRMLNQLYTAFDVLTDPKKNQNVYKVYYIIIVRLKK